MVQESACDFLDELLSATDTIDYLFLLVVYYVLALYFGLVCGCGWYCVGRVGCGENTSVWPGRTKALTGALSCVRSRRQCPS